MRSLDPRDPSTWKQQVLFVADHVAQNGWGAFHGAKAAKIGNWQNIGDQPQGQAPGQAATPAAPAGGGGQGGLISFGGPGASPSPAMGGQTAPASPMAAAGARLAAQQNTDLDTLTPGQSAQRDADVDAATTVRPGGFVGPNGPQAREPAASGLAPTFDKAAEGRLRDTLRELFPSAQMSMMGALARDAEAGTRWRTSTAVKGGSDSVKNLLASLDKVGKGEGGHAPTVGFVAAELLGFGLEKIESVGWKAAGLATMGAGVAYMGNSLRSAGIRNTANLYREAMANPELARALISKMPAAVDGSALHNLARVLRRGVIVGPALARQDRGAKS